MNERTLCRLQVIARDNLSTCTVEQDTGRVIMDSDHGFIRCRIIGSCIHVINSSVVMAERILDIDSPQDRLVIARTLRKHSPDQETTPTENLEHHECPVYKRKRDTRRALNGFLLALAERLNK